MGWTDRAIEHRVRTGQWRVVHPGVYALAHAPLTDRQLWFAATLTAPGTFLSHASAGACWGFRPRHAGPQTVIRPGSGGAKRLGGIVVYRSKVLDGDTGRLEGIPITTAARTLIDLAPRLSPRAVSKAVREALRLKATTTREIVATLARHRGRRGTRLLWDLTDRYSSLPYSETRSDAEARALEVLADAGLQPDKINRRIAGAEADLIWHSAKRIVEIDGPQYHQFKEEDVRKQALWEAAGYTVHRIVSDDVFDDPAALLALARR
jgi:very-short-patch-repair endonuclease